MKRIEVKSDNIKSIGYNSENVTLEVEFHSKKEGKPTRIYQYTPFTSGGYTMLMTAKSKGKFFWKFIRDNSDIKYVQVDEKGNKIEKS